MSNTGTGRRPMIPSDLARLRSVASVALHPADGSTVFVVTRPDLDNDRNESRLWVLTAEGGQAQLLTEGDRDRQPTFSPDGRRLAFVRSASGGSAGVAVLDWADRSVSIVGTFDEGVASLRWAGPDRLVVLAGRRTPDQRDLDLDPTSTSTSGPIGRGPSVGSTTGPTAGVGSTTAPISPP